MINGKLKQTLESRKFLLTAGTIILGVVLFFTGQIDIDRLMSIVERAGGFYLGALGFEDGLKRLAPVFLNLMNKDK